MCIWAVNSAAGKCSCATIPLVRAGREFVVCHVAAVAAMAAKGRMAVQVVGIERRFRGLEFRRSLKFRTS